MLIIRNHNYKLLKAIVGLIALAIISTTFAVKLANANPNSNCPDSKECKRTCSKGTPQKASNAKGLSQADLIKLKSKNKIDENLAQMPKHVPALLALAGYPVELYSTLYNRLPTETEYWEALNELPWDMSDFKNHQTYKLINPGEFYTKWTWFKDKSGKDVYYESTNKYMGRVKPGECGCDCEPFLLQLKNQYNWTADEMHTYFRNEYIGELIANLHWVYTESNPAARSIEELEALLGLERKPNFDFHQAGLKLNFDPIKGNSYQIRLKADSEKYSQPYRFKIFGKDQFIAW